MSMSQWCHPTISSSAAPFSCPKPFLASGSFPMSQLFESGGQRIGASASVLPMTIQGWFPLGLTGLISCYPRDSQEVFSRFVRVLVNLFKHSLTVYNSVVLWVFLWTVWASQVVLVVRNPLANAGDVKDMGSNPGLERSSAEGHSNPLQYSCLENPTDRRAWWATVQRVAQCQTWLKWFSSEQVIEFFPVPSIEWVKLGGGGKTSDNVILYLY